MAGSVQAPRVLQFHNIQRMIDINASNLDGLRTQCTTTSDLVQQEIRDQEAKLVKLFSRMLVARQEMEAAEREVKSKPNCFDYHQYPRLEQWLHVVGIQSCGIKALVEKYGSFGSLLAAPEHRLKGVLIESNASDDDTFKLISALNHLREFTEKRKEGKNSHMSSTYSWSYGRENPTLNSSSSSSQSSIAHNDEPLPTPGPDLSVDQSNARKRPPMVNIKRSKSDELARMPNLEALCLSPGGSLGKNKGRNLWITIPKNGSMDHLSSEKPEDGNSTGSNNSNSPKTPTRINLGDKHKFSTKHVMIGSQCVLCKKQIFRGVKCKQCGLKLHKRCYKNGPPLSGCQFVRTTISMTRNNRYYGSLPNRWKRTISEPTSIANQLSNPVENASQPFNTSHGDLFQNTSEHRKRGYGEPPFPFSYGHHLLSGVLNADAGSMSSVTSTPQSSPPGSISIPVPVSAPPQGDYDGFDRRPCYSRSVRRRKGLGVFVFPDNVDSLDDESDLASTDSILVRTESIQSAQSTITMQSNDSTISGDDAPTVDSLESQISDYDSLTRTWSSKRMERDSHFSEWTIPFNDIELQERIGVGGIGEVYRGNWHGQVAVKVIDIQQPTVTQLAAFKVQVQTFRKTRHENLVLFMGACMEPPKLAIITSLCKDSHLYKRIHVFKEMLPVTKVMLILKQIAQGMSYLHSRGIIHADLKSKNIFFENDSKVVITDFGHLRLAAGLSVEKTRPGTVKIPFGWLNYLAPEIICLLSPHQKLAKKTFTKESDVYAFGTLCYELLCGAWPFIDYSLETIIYQVGKGAKQSLSKLDVAREMKDLINLFWAYHPAKRPQFKNILKILDKIPVSVTKGRLYRSPSQPVTHMLRTLEVNPF